MQQTSKLSTATLNRTWLHLITALMSQISWNGNNITKDINSTCHIDCKTACSSTREQSNKRSEMRLKTESETEERRFARVRLLRHALSISLLILRKKTYCFAVYMSYWTLEVYFTLYVTPPSRSRVSRISLQSLLNVAASTEALSAWS